MIGIEKRFSFLMATIKDIAKKLNISVSTVSYVMNDGPRNVPDAVKARVLAAADELGYRPNRIARMLVTQKSHTIGVVPDQMHIDAMVGPFLRNVFNTILNVAEEQSQDVLFMTTHSERVPEIYANSVTDGRVDGVIMIGADQRKPLIDILLKREFPHVLINTHCSTESAVFTIDNAAGIDLLTNHLYQLGHRKFGLIGGLPGNGDSQIRESAFDKFVQNSDAFSKPEWREWGNFNLEGGFQAAKKILSQKDKPTAIVALNDESALGALRCAQELGLKIPSDLSITGFDNTEWVQLTEIPITTIAQNEQAIAQAATRSLLKQIAGEPAQSQVFPPELVVRASTSHPKKDSFQ